MKIPRIASLLTIRSLASLYLVSAMVTAQQETATLDPKQQQVLDIAKEVRKQIVTLPQYGVFDNIHFAIKGNTVVLRGQASRPTLKSSAENVVKRIKGVENVDNRIEVLPLSPNDDRIRAAVYASIYRYPRCNVIRRTVAVPEHVRLLVRPLESPMIRQSAIMQSTSSCETAT